jgi:serine/threonine protein kinase
MTATIPIPKVNGLTDYDITTLLGEGGMGKVYLARHKRTDELAVIKTIHEHLLHEAKTRQRFQQETDLMRRFRHPNAVAFLQASPPEVEPPFIVMEYVQGITLDQLMSTHDRLTPIRAGRILAPLCLFLQVAHDNGLLHRDLTPANIMVLQEGTPRETIKVMDFGLARQIGFYIPSGQLNSNSSTIDGGTPDYICPEQIQGVQVDHRGDLYSVGVLMYGLLTGHVPFEEQTEPSAILKATLKETPPPFAHWQINNVPPPVEALVLACLSKSPKDRPESARALIEAYQNVTGCRFVDSQAFDSSRKCAISSLHERHRFNIRDVIDRFDATMVEHTAAIKLRGFFDGVGGEVEESDAGVIKVRLPRITEVPLKKNAFTAWFGPQTEKHIDWIGLEIHMAKKRVESRDMLNITVTRPRVGVTDAAYREHKEFCEHICRELRAYLMAGR